MKNSRKRHESNPEGSVQADGSDAEAAIGDTQGQSAEGEPTQPDRETDPSDSGAQAAEEPTETERYMRLAAEYDNFRKRTAKERTEIGARAQGELVRLLVDALDDLSRFAHVDPAVSDSATIVQGVEMVERKLMGELAKSGLEVISPVDQAFDPSIHEAVGTEPTPAKEDDHLVARVYQPGYLFKGQLLRPARVVVKQWTA